MPLFFDCFFFQAEDGIRDLTVTGVQTCALPISLPLQIACSAAPVPDTLPPPSQSPLSPPSVVRPAQTPGGPDLRPDRKSTRLNSSHSQISYAVFCLKKKKKIQQLTAISDLYPVQ